MKRVLPDHCVSRHPIRVRFGETDLMGIVHHGTYISYFEVGRVEYMRRRGLNYTSWTEMGFHLPVVEAYVRYRRSVRFDELVVIETRLIELARVRVRFSYRLLRPSDNGIGSTNGASNGASVVNGSASAAADEVLAEGYTLLACVGRDHVPRRLPPQAEAVLMGPEVDDVLPEPPHALAAP